MSNLLKKESSPYLLQHADNPVDWYPWCGEAFAKANREDKPVFLSIGYSTCHWCHVMAHESFENEEIAEILNRHFVAIKVDREERPDIDSVYMAVCQAFTGRGGWPMSIFMTGEQKPFFAGTYFPAGSRNGMIGFRELLLTVAEKWQSNRAGLLDTANAIVDSLNTGAEESRDGIRDELPRQGAEIFLESFDARNGGFGSAPKFPTPHNLIFLMLYSHLRREGSSMEAAKITLEKMRRGGIFDHIGYGFSRYSTDEYFLVPHFEKMLYDNALLIMAYSVGYKASGEGVFLDTAEKTAEYIFREMTGSEGQFYSAQDADSEGEEGRFYVWDFREICDILGEKDGKRFCAEFGITEQGNFEGKNIPNLLKGGEISDSFSGEIEKLYYARKSRAKLHLDDKILTSWNALMISAMAMLYRVTGKQIYLDAAKKAQGFIEKYLVREGVLYVGRRESAPSVKGFLEEYAYYAMALLSLYDVTFEEKYLERAEGFCAEADRQFLDEKNGGYFLYGVQNDDLIARPKETYDGALPSGNSVMAYCLVRLFHLRGHDRDKERAERQLSFLSGEAAHYPAGYSLFLISLLCYQNPPQKITVVLSQESKEQNVWKELPLYAEIKILSEETPEYKLLDGKTTYYVCKDQMCLPPSHDTTSPLF